MIHTFVVESVSGKVRADKWITGKIEGTSRSIVKKAFEDGLVQVNGTVVLKSVKLRPGDVNTTVPFT
jgi:ribosomal 50S subunit-recycling heat shock protein